MILMMIMFIFILMISFLLIFLNILLSKKLFNIREKIYPLECGFNKMNKLNLPFSIQFYYISILFLIFDIEIVLILPFMLKIMSFYLNKWFISFFFIILILIIGLYYEWINNLIKWN